MQVVLWFAGLRGAIAFALSQYVQMTLIMLDGCVCRDMPGTNRDLYTTTTLTGTLRPLPSSRDVSGHFHDDCLRRTHRTATQTN